MAKGLGKGKTNNPNGRGKGVPNKSTTLAREAIATFVDNNTHRLERLLDKIEEDSAKDAFDAITKVMEYHLPKLARTDTNLTGNVTTTIQVVSKIPYAPNEKPIDN